MAAFQLQADVRDDPEQQERFQQCVDLLVAAGYFRARIRGLSPFDKLVGGMVWCIEMCNQDVDVDLFYKDTLSIGQKIAVTERIIEVLPQMSCPHRIDPHQIQGLDCLHIYPVMQWLVKQALEHQAQRSGYYLSYGVYLFNKQHPELAPPDQQPASVSAQPELHLSPAHTEKLQFRDEVASVVSRAENSSHFPEGLEATLQELALKDQAEQQHTRLMTSLSTQLTDTERRMAAVAERFEALQQRHSRLTAELEQAQAEEQQLTADEAEVNQGLDQQNLVLLEQIAESFQEADSVLAEEHRFKEQCRLEFTQLQDEISRLEAAEGGSADGADPDQDLQQLTDQVNQLRAKVAACSRQMALLNRQLDDVPSRPEISQYQKRFIELYNQVSATHKEAKEYYATNNLLSDTLVYLGKELSLLNSVAENYRTASSSASTRAQLLQQLDSIVQYITSNKEKVEQQRLAERRSVERLTEELEALRALSRQYHSRLKQFRDECARNEQLTAQRADS